MTEGKKKVQTQEITTNATPIFDMSKAVPIENAPTVSEKDAEIIDAGLVLGTDEARNKHRLKQALKRVLKQQRQLPEPDYSLPAFNDPARLREWMNVLGITQSDLAREAGVSQQRISEIENGKPFTEPSRSKIWQALQRLQDDKIEKDLMKKIDEGEDFSGASVQLFKSIGLFKTPLERANEEIELLRRERDLAREQRDTLKQLVDMNLLDHCAGLEKKLADAYQEIADFHRLFALRGSSVAGDELQAQIEARQRPKPEQEV